MTASPPLIQLNDLTKVYRMGEVEVRALDGISLTIQHREFVAIMGSSGSGKSTVMNIIGCLDRPSSGRYLLAGQDVSRLGRAELAEIRNKTVGFVFQNFNLLARTSALENVELPLLYAEVAGRDRRRRAGEALARVGLGDRLRHHPSQLSGGQQQRVAIARALVGNPKLILADEPTGNLDSRTRVEVMTLFDVAEHASRLVVLKDGRVADDRRRAAEAPLANDPLMPSTVEAVL